MKHLSKSGSRGSSWALRCTSWSSNPPNRCLCTLIIPWKMSPLRRWKRLFWYPLLGVNIPYQHLSNRLIKVPCESWTTHQFYLQSSKPFLIYTENTVKNESFGGPNCCFGTRLLVCTYHMKHLSKLRIKALCKSWTTHQLDLKSNNTVFIYTRNTMKMSPSEGQNGRFGTRRLVCTYHMERLWESRLKAPCESFTMLQSDLKSNKMMLIYTQNTVNNSLSWRLKTAFLAPAAWCAQTIWTSPRIAL